MHPRNIYNTRLDFKLLSEISPDLKQHLILRPNGKLSMNFQDPEALRSLAKVLLKKDFNLEIEIPINSLVPTIPLRLNYILFIEDLLEIAQINSNVIGIDIGTGGSCIYPLIATRKNNWKMICTDSNGVNYKYALSNVIKNNLGEYIKVVQVSGETTLKELLDQNDLQYTFCMCNPPFFGGEHELSSQFKARKPDRRKPHNAFTASKHEVVTEGGEVEFVTKIINESYYYRDRVKIFTTMLGIKKSLQILINLLKSSKEIKSFVQTEFIQGNTTRWGLAWTFYNYNLNVLKTKNSKSKKPFIHSQIYNGTIETIGVQIEAIFNDLKMDFKIVKKQNNSRLYNIIAYFNTWIHDRKKRREADRMKKIMEGLPPIENEINTPMETSFEDKKIDAEVCKRKISDDDEEGDEDDHKKVHQNNDNLKSNNILTKLIEASVYVVIEDDQLIIEMTPLADTTNRDNLHQILLYVKNHLVLDK